MPYANQKDINNHTVMKDRRADRQLVKDTIVVIISYADIANKIYVKVVY